MKVDLDHVVSNFASLTQSLEVVAKKRDEQRSLIDKPTVVEMAQKPSAASVDDMLLLKLSAERVQSHIEQVSVQIISCFERSFHGFMQPIWDSSPEAFKEPYICSVVSERMFSGFENENFMVNEAASAILDLETLKKESMRKYLELCNENAQDLMISDYSFNQFACVTESLVLKDVKKIMLVATVNLGKVLMSGDIQ